jgi:hypothetical protein
MVIGPVCPLAGPGGTRGRPGAPSHPDLLSLSAQPVETVSGAGVAGEVVDV